MRKDLNIPKYTLVYPLGGMTMESTTLKVQERTKKELDLFRESKNESYDEVLQKMIYIVKLAKDNPKLSQKTIKAVEAARERIKKGKFISETEMKKRLGL